ncbi:MAG: acyclic terpene utilization AtuA family protein [Xanthobacteraceae bacterium]
MQQLVRIGCAAGFAGDRADAALPIIGELASHRDPRFLMFETLAERTLALCQLEKRRDPARGYSPALERMLPGALGPCLENGIRIIGNFGAANPRAAGERIATLARAAGFPRPRIAVIEGDDVSDLFSTEELAARQMDGKVLGPCANIVAANVYLGAEPIARAFDEGAEVVVTGRVADPALALGPLVHAHRWDWKDWQRLASGTLAGHLLECAGQVTGGYFADPGRKDVPGLAELGYPIAEVEPSGELIITKPVLSGGIVDRRTVAEQILYEVHDPSAYLTPDVILDITDVEVMPVGPDRVRVVGARGKPRPETLKATAFLASGMLGEAEISYAGPNAPARAQLAAEIVTTRMAKRMPELQIRVDLVGRASLFGTLAPACSTDADATAEVRLRFAAQHAEREPLELLLDEVEALYCSGPAGGAGVRRYLTPRLASASCLIERDKVVPSVTFLGASE